ncbi:MAG: hypothetical protein KKG12_01760, partial [Gammaproteobacteria bacterium]|nr:hypothetical protein [Gammaproteobacteria bacterium]
MRSENRALWWRGWWCASAACALPLQETALQIQQRSAVFGRVCQRIFDSLSIINVIVKIVCRINNTKLLETTRRL